MGWCTVTSLVPSGKVASTWMSGIISATPSITSARDVATLEAFGVRPQWGVTFLKAYVPGTTLPEPETRL